MSLYISTSLQVLAAVLQIANALSDLNGWIAMGVGVVLGALQVGLHLYGASAAASYLK